MQEFDYTVQLKTTDIRQKKDKRGEDNMPISIILADDHKIVREGLKQLLEIERTNKL